MRRSGFGNETGIRRGLDRLEAGRVKVELAPQIESFMRAPGAPFAFGSDAEYDPQVSAFTSQLPFLKGMSMMRAVGNFDSPGVNIAGTLTYKDGAQAEQGAASLQGLQQHLAAYGFLASVIGLAQPIQQMQVSRVDSRATGSALPGSAKSSWMASHIDVPAPADPPVEATRRGSSFHSFSRWRSVCSARALSRYCAGAGASSVKR